MNGIIFTVRSIKQPNNIQLFFCIHFL
jgi:hypothetical protein